MEREGASEETLPPAPEDPAPEKRKTPRSFWTFGIKAVNSRESLYNSVDLKHGSYKVILMLPLYPPYKRVRTYIDKCQIGFCSSATKEATMEAALLPFTLFHIITFFTIFSHYQHMITLPLSHHVDFVLHTTVF